MEANQALAAALKASPPEGVVATPPAGDAPATASAASTPAAASAPETKAEEHPLETAWKLWYDKKQIRRSGVKQSYKDNLRPLGTFNTLEGFWRYYVHLKRPSDLQRDVNCYLFRDGCTPMWEEFPNGGCWILKVRKHTGVLSKMWQDLVFGAIGECFEEPGVVGVGLAIRSKEDMLSVWHRNNANDNTRFFIGEKLKTILNLDKDILVEYKTFARSITDKSTYSNTQAYVFAAAKKAGGNAGGRGGNRGNSGGNGNAKGNRRGAKRRNNSSGNKSRTGAAGKGKGSNSKAAASGSS